MKICIIGGAGATHIEKWSKYLTDFGHDVIILSLVEDKSDYARVITLGNQYDWRQSDLEKAKAVMAARKIKHLIKEIDPDVISVHYATSYGLLAALSGIRNYILSVWGADVYDFPQRSVLHKLLLKYALKKATHIFSTSSAMSIETAKYTNKHIDITPFGVDMDLFNPNKRTRDNDNRIIIGTVKTLNEKYGISYLIKAFFEATKALPDIPLELRIAGKGPQEENYKALVNDLGIDDKVKWLGFISQEEAAVEWANMDIGVVYSTLESESFGVSAVEALASGTPLIISDVPGLMESTGDGKNAVVVPRKNQSLLNDALLELISNECKRKELAESGREYVVNAYSAEKCFRDVEELFRKYSIK